MSASFDSATFLERSSGEGYATWGKAGVYVVKKISGSDKNVIQIIGIALPRLAMPIAGTKAEMQALQGKVGVQGSLVFSYETTTARLESMAEPVSIGIGNDLYFSTLNLVRSNGAISTTPASAWLTEAGDPWLTETGDPWITEA